RGLGTRSRVQGSGTTDPGAIPYRARRERTERDQNGLRAGERELRRPQGRHTKAHRFHRSQVETPWRDIRRIQSVSRCLDTEVRGLAAPDLVAWKYTGYGAELDRGTPRSL